MNFKTRTELESMTIPQLKEYADSLKVQYTSKVKKADLIDDIRLHITDQLHDAPEQDSKPEPTTLVPNRAALRRMGQRSPKRKVVVSGDVMGLHHRGRALGLKHYRAMGLALGRTCPPEWRNNRQALPLPNSERVQNYVRGNPMVYPKLTTKQFRRVRKHMDPTTSHNDVSPYPVRREVPAGYTKLAVTPDGKFNLLMQFAR